MARAKYSINVWAVVAFLMAILFLASLTYIIVSKYKQAKVEWENKLISQGYQYAILQIIDEAQTCETIILSMGNESVELMPINCEKAVKVVDGGIVPMALEDLSFLGGLNGTLGSLL